MNLLVQDDIENILEEVLSGSLSIYGLNYVNDLDSKKDKLHLKFKLLSAITEFGNVAVVNGDKRTMTAEYHFIKIFHYILNFINIADNAMSKNTDKKISYKVLTERFNGALKRAENKNYSIGKNTYFKDNENLLSEAICALTNLVNVFVEKLEKSDTTLFTEMNSIINIIVYIWHKNYSIKKIDNNDFNNFMNKVRVYLAHWQYMEDLKELNLLSSEYNKVTELFGHYTIIKSKLDMSEKTTYDYYDYLTIEDKNSDSENFFDIDTPYIPKFGYSVAEYKRMLYSNVKKKSTLSIYSDIIIKKIGAKYVISLPNSISKKIVEEAISCTVKNIA